MASEDFQCRIWHSHLVQQTMEVLGPAPMEVVIDVAVVYDGPRVRRLDMVACSDQAEGMVTDSTTTAIRSTDS